MISLETASDRYRKIDSFAELAQLKNQILELKDFGVLQLSLRRAAELMSLEVFTSGDLKVEADPQEWIDIYDESLLAALKPSTDEYLEILKKGVDIGRLPTTLIKRDLDDSIDEDKTFVDLTDFEVWLNERDFPPGDIFQDYFDKELSISVKISEEIIWLRSKAYRDNRKSAYSKVNITPLSDNCTIEEIRAAYQALQLENERLSLALSTSTKAAPSRNEAPASPRHRKTLLILIAALCEEAKINPQARGAAQRIEKLTEKLGARVDDETIRRVLGALVDALDSQ